MKKFIISVLCVSVFFIGLGGLVERTSAKFKSDARALELVRLARVAIGGDSNINNVRSMTIKGTSAHTMIFNGAAETKSGETEINFQLPDKFSKMTRIGEPGDGADIQKNVDVVIMRKDDGGTIDVKGVGDGKKVVIVKDGDGKVLTEDIKPADGQRKIIIKKADGTVLTEDIKPGDGDTTFTTADGKNIIVNKDVKVIRAGEGDGAMRHNEMLRTTLALLLTAPEGTEVSYTFAGETTVDGAACNIVEASSNGSSFKLFLDKSTNLPKMISYLGMPMHIMKFEKPAPPDGSDQKDVKVFVRKTDAPEASVERQVKFSDFRSVGGLLLPYKWTETVGGNTGETVDITNYEINPSNIAEKFQNEKIKVRTQKP